MKMWKFSILLAIIIEFSVSAKAYTPVEGNVSAFLAPYIYKTNFSGSSTGASSPLLGGVSLIAIGDISSKGSLELGMFHMNKVFFREEGGNYLGEKTQVIHITMGYRRYWNERYSCSLTFFSAYPMGDIHVVHNDFPPGSLIDTSARDYTDYGIDFAIQSELWKSEEVSVDLDTRYSRSFTSKPGENSDHYGFLLGVRYFIQGK